MVDLKTQKFLWWGLPNQVILLEADFSRYQWQQKSESFRAQEGFHVVTAWKGRNAGDERGLCWQPTRKQGPQSYDHKDLNSVNKLNEPEIDPSLGSPDKSPAWPILIWLYESLSREPIWALLVLWPIDLGDHRWMLLSESSSINWYILPLHFNPP